MFKRLQSLHLGSTAWQKMIGVSVLRLLKIFTFTFLLIKIVGSSVGEDVEKHSLLMGM